MRCYKCFRPQEFCLCSYTEPPIDAGIKFIFLMHPKEAKRQRTGTGRLAHITLQDSEIIVGLDFSENRRLQELLADERFFPLLMYPGDGAWNVNTEGFCEMLGRRILMPIIIDATWFCSRKIIEHNPFLLQLPKFSFAHSYSSIFTFKREPHPECVSTIETCYYLIKELQAVGAVSEAVCAEPLMDIFKRLISDQLRAENERVQGLRPSTHGYDWKYNKVKEVPF